MTDENAYWAITDEGTSLIVRLSQETGEAIRAGHFVHVPDGKITCQEFCPGPKPHLNKYRAIDRQSS